MKEVIIEAKKREANVRNIHRKARREDYIPAVIYNKKGNTPIRLARLSFSQIFKKSHSNTIFTIQVEGAAKKAFIKDYQESLDKTSDLIHVDFFEIEAGSKIKIKIPVHTKGLAKGIMQGGILEHMMSQIEVRCTPENIPEFIEIDVTDLDIGDHFKVRDLKLPANIEVLDQEVRSIVAIVTTAAVEAEAAPTAAAAGDAAAPAPGAAPAAGKEGEKGKEAAKAPAGKEAPAAKKDAKPGK